MSTKPGVHEFFEWSKLEYTEAEIVKKLSQVWFITHADGKIYKSSYFSFVFGKPTDKLTHDFQFEQEILFLFNPYPSVDARTTDVIDQLINSHYPNRLDKLCIVVIARDNDVKNWVRNRLLKDKESRIFIPYTYDEFQTSNFREVIIIERLKEFFFERDLFDYSSPLLTEHYFFGRIQAVQWLYSKYKSGENACLFGLKRIGKTSTLYAVKRSLELRGEPVVLLDCSDPSFHTKRWHESLQYVVNQLTRVMGSSDTSVQLSQKYDEKNASDYFERDLTEIYSYLGKKRILLIFDEIGGITFEISASDHWKNEKDYIYFWQSIRAVFQKRSNLFSFILAGINPTAVETSSFQGIDNPLYRLVTSNYLNFFDVDEVKEMVSYIGNYMGLKFENEVFTYLADDYGGHPYLIRQVCSQIHQRNKQRPFKVTKWYYKSDREKLTRKIYDYIEQILEILVLRYPVEYELLQRLAHGDIETFIEYAQTSYKLVEHLIGYGIISEDSGNYYFRIKGVEDFIREQGRVSRLKSTPEERRNEIYRRQSRLEESLRRIIKLVLKSNLGLHDAQSNVLDVLGEPRKKKLMSLTFDEIFFSDKTELYFYDLGAIIKKFWIHFERIFGRDQEKFLKCMESVNRARRVPAHLLPIDEVDYQYSAACLKWLEDCVDDYLA